MPKPVAVLLPDDLILCTVRLGEMVDTYVKTDAAQIVATRILRSEETGDTASEHDRSPRTTYAQRVV